MKKLLRDYGVPASLFLIKFLTTWRTAADTYAVSGDWLNVALIDGVFLGLWFLLAYGGENQYAKRSRPFAVLGAWALYIMMLIIGWSAHHGIVAIAVRVAGGLGLLLDTWDYVISTLAPAWQRWQHQRAQPADVTQFGQRLMQNHLKRSIRRSAGALRPHMDTLVLEQMRDALPEVVYGRVSRVTDDPQATIASTAITVRKPVVARWEAVAPLLPSGQEFRRVDVEAIADCKRSLANDLVNYGISIGAIREVDRGVYVYANGNKQLVEVINGN